jgi:hypothetical protein
MGTNSPASGSKPFVPAPFVLLWRLFFAQFFTSESVTSDIHLRERAVWVLAFLLAPCVFIVILLYPEFTAAVIRARVGRGPASYVDDMLGWVAFVLTTYSMAGTGLITVLAWDALTFEHRDAAILGPLPLRRVTLITAKLAALGTLLLAGSIPINVLNAAVFAFASSDQLGGAVLVTHFVSIFVATVGASTFIFAAIVMLRGTVALLGGPRLTSVLGPLLQFAFVLALLCLVILCPAVSPTRFITNANVNWLPSAWFMSVFEELRGSPRAFDIEFQFLPLAQRAAMATVLAVTGAVIVSVVEFRRHIDLARVAAGEHLRSARVSRILARMLVGRNAVARATSDFILLTIARNRMQQGPIAINAAIGAAIVIAALSREARDLSSLMHLRTAVLWIPLVLSYALAVGVRASFFVPSELPASWVFCVNPAASPDAYWSAVRASMVGLVVPPALLIAAVVTTPLLGWRVTAYHALFVCAMTTLLVEWLALTIHHIPFTRPYQPGHAKLKTRWWLYALGLLAFAYVPARLELRLFGDPVRFVVGVTSMALAIAALEVVGRQRGGRWLMEEGAESASDVASVTVLNLGIG